MSVLQFSTMVPPAGYGGAERVVGWLSEQLEAAGLPVHNAGLSARGADEPQAYPIPNLYWPFDGASRGVVARSAWHLVDAVLLTGRARVEQIFDRVQPTVAVTHNLRGWGLAPWVVARERGVPLVQVVHDYGLICNTGTLWRGQPCDGLCAPCKLRARVAAQRWPGGQVVGVSRAVLDAQAAHGVELAEVAGVLHPVAAAASTSSATTRGRDGAIETLGFIGRITPAKGLDLLLEAMRGSTRRLLVAGAGEDAYVDELRRGAPTNVSWRGWVDPDEFFSEIDVLVVPSAWPEPFGLVVVEAANAGVPVLLADHPGAVEAAQASQARFATFVANERRGLVEALERPMSDYTTEAAPVAPLDLVSLIVATATSTDVAGPGHLSHGR